MMKTLVINPFCIILFMAMMGKVPVHAQKPICEKNPGGYYEHNASSREEIIEIFDNEMINCPNSGIREEWNYSVCSGIITYMYIAGAYYEENFRQCPNKQVTFCLEYRNEAFSDIAFDIACAPDK